ncbi:MAG: GyrI-like domain-containing protein [Thermoplasmata archaeon]
MAPVKLETRKPQVLAYVEHVGPYSEIPFDTYVEKLYGWAKEKGVRPGFYPLGIYYDSPDETPADECRSEIAIPIFEKAGPDGEVKVRESKEMQVAAISHKGPAADYAKTYQVLSEWVAQHGYEWAGPSIEVYSKKPEVVGDETILYAKVMAPVRKKESTE